MDFRSTLALRFRRFAFVAVLGTALTAHGTAQAPPQRPFGTLRDQAAMQQQWLRKRLDTFLPSLMRKHGVDMWIVPMREYNEDPVFSALVAPETFAARRRTLYVVAVRLPEEEAFFTRMQELVWSMTQEMFSSRTITPGTTRTSDLAWWWRQRVNDLGLATWFQPTVDVQRKGVAEDKLGEDPIIERGDVLHCDVGITVARLNTDTQHLAYVLRPGEEDAPEGLRKALANANALQDMTMEEIRPGRTGNEILGATLARMKARGIQGSVYSHPIGLHGHGAGPLIGLWDYQDGVAGRGDAKVIPSMWFSIELQATTPVPEWGGQPVRMAQEEDAVIAADGKIRWALRRQDRLFLVK